MRHTPLSLACVMLLVHATGLRAQVTTAPSGSPSEAPVATPDTSASQYQSNAQLVQLVPGTTIVTPYSYPEGDLESIKQIVSNDARGLRFHYSSKLWKGEKGRDISVYRLIPPEDKKAGKLYRINFSHEQTELWSGSTWLGVSTEILRALKSGKKSKNSISRRHYGRNTALSLKDSISISIRPRSVPSPGSCCRAWPRCCERIRPGSSGWREIPTVAWSWSEPIRRNRCRVHQA